MDSEIESKTAMNYENLLAHKVSESIFFVMLDARTHKRKHQRGANVMRMDLKPFECIFIRRKHSIWLKG